MHRFVRTVPFVVALVLAGAGVIACSSSNDDSSGSQPTSVAAQPTQSSGGSTASPTSAAATRVTVVDFSYAPAELTARAGQPVTLNVVNNGQAPHTFTITGVADSGTISAGQSKTVTFTPSTAGTLQFFCTIHGAATMSGKLTVQ